MLRTTDYIWHGLLGRPYKLAATEDFGSGPGIVLLHGIGRSGAVWKYVTGLLRDNEGSSKHRVVAFDLLGFGASPKPARINYTVDDHAKSLIASIEKLGRSKPVIIVGHSMGCLVAVRVAKQRPDLVRHLILYEMPIYEGLPEELQYRARINMYFKFYDWISRQQPGFDAVKQRFAERIASKVVGSELTADTWQPFVKSLKNTIMKQTAAQELPTLKMPVDIIYGSRDMLVIRGKVQKILGLDSDLVKMHTINERHIISPKASKFLVERINAARKRRGRAVADGPRLDEIP